MTFRRKLMTVFSLVVLVSVAGVALLVSAVTRRVFERNEEERTAGLVTQFRREFNRQGEIVAARVETIAASDALNRVALALNRVPADAGPYFELAKTTAENNQLDFLELVESDGTIVSSAQSPEKFASAEGSIASLISAAGQGAFLKQEQLQDGAELGLFAVRASRAGEHPIYIIGGRRLDKLFLSTLDMPADMRVLLYQNRGNGFSAESIVDPAPHPGADPHPANELEPIVDAVLRSKQELTRRLEWTSDAAEDEEFHAIPLMGKLAGGERPLLAILLVGNSRRTYVELMRHIRSVAILVGGSGIALAILLSSWAAARVTRPVEKLASAVQEVTAGNWNIYVEVNSADEIGRLADSFNRMTTELLGQKERLVQAERVAAWRELARRLAHELKNPLFPLQLTVENLIRTRQQQPEEFEDAFRESSRTLLAEIANLKEIIGKFSDFSKMPQPQLRAIQVNEVVRGVMQLFQTQIDAPGRAKIKCEMNLDAHAPVMGDAELLHRAISNLVLNAIEAMPQGGTLSLRTRDEGGNVVVEVTDTGAGMTPEECEKIFTPYYTSKRQGTGLGLAIAQSIVSDHGGRIRVQSEAGRGATFVIELARPTPTC
jgi:two-component system, NtrC family, nitrogen regulation sensor histidine kinase NtrY